MRFLLIFSIGYFSLLSSSHASQQTDGLEKHLIAGAAGAARAIAGLPIEHPLDTIKTRWQAFPQATSSFVVAKDIYSQKGIAGFYSGVVPNSIRLASKQLYRWPMMLAFPPFFDTMIPEHMAKENPRLRKILTGLAIANFEVFIINPMERLKVFLMTGSKQQSPILNFISDNRHRLVSELYRGLNAAYPRQIVAWTTFLWADDYFKTMAKEMSGQTELSYENLLGVSLAVGTVNTLTTLPLDCIKTQFQMAHPLQKLSVVDAFKNTLATHGVRGLYAGIGPRMLQYMIQSVFTVSLLEKLERRFAKP